MLKLLDVFCGLGGVSDGFALEGFDVTGVDIENMPAVGYKHRFIKTDLRALSGQDYRGFDVIWGSPPCREFSIIAKTLGHTWKRKPNAVTGLELVNYFKQFVAEASPRYWIMENVSLLKQFIGKPVFETSLNGNGMRRGFWGTFPQPLIPKDINKKISVSKSGRLDGIGFDYKLKSWQRAKIPLTCSRAFAKTIKEALLNHGFA